jgi:hypothetical protein
MSTETIQVLKTIIASKQPSLTAECLAISSGCKHITIKQLAEKYDITRQAVSRRIRNFATQAAKTQP